MYEHLNQLSTFSKKVAIPCQANCKFTKEITPSQEDNEIRIPLTTEPSKYLITKSALFSHTSMPCYKSSCKGEVTFNAWEFEKGKEPLYLVVRNCGALNGPEDFMNLPKEISIQGQKYQMGMLNMFDRHMTHFKSLHYVQNQFLFYDGQNKTKKKFRRAFPSDFKQETIYLEHVLYVKMVDNKSI